MNEYIMSTHIYAFLCTVSLCLIGLNIYGLLPDEYDFNSPNIYIYLILGIVYFALMIFIILYKLEV